MRHAARRMGGERTAAQGPRRPTSHRPFLLAQPGLSRRSDNPAALGIKATRLQGVATDAEGRATDLMGTHRRSHSAIAASTITPEAAKVYHTLDFARLKDVLGKPDGTRTPTEEM